MKEKILLALSDPKLDRALTEQLTQNGFTVESVQSGNDVIGKMKSLKPDLLLVDVVLPDKNGYEIMNEKSLDRDVTKIPVIVVSNSGEPIQMNKIPSTPMVRDYIIRSHVDPVEAMEKIERVFGRGMPNQGNMQAKPAMNGKKILWAEDDKLLSTILSKKIETSGFVLLKANSGEEVFKYLETEVPDVIVLDIMLPNMSGLDILQKIKTNDKLRSIPTIILSNLNKQSDIEKAKTLGANKFMVKAAVSLDEIIAEVNSLTK